MPEKQFSSDSKGFPMIWVEPLKGYLHWLPITKIQFERFLCSTSDIEFDDKWYDEILTLNPRESPQDLERDNYWRSVLTGLLPSEAEKYARWCGPQYQIPTKDDWLKAYFYLKEKEAQEIDWTQHEPGLLPRDLRLLENMERVFRGFGGERQTMADQTFLRFGVMEWVQSSERAQAWGGLGQLSPDFYGLLTKPEHRTPVQPRNPASERFFYFGFRLLRKEQ